MNEIAFHITDITENSIRAGADRIEIALNLDGVHLNLIISDNGCGMDAQTIDRVSDPFYTTRTTRRVGLGLSFLFQNTAQCCGNATIESEPGKGSKVSARFPLDHIDSPPIGDLATTFMLALTGNPSANVVLRFSCDGRTATLSTSDLIDALDGIPISHPKIASVIREMVDSSLAEVFGTRLSNPIQIRL